MADRAVPEKPGRLTVAQCRAVDRYAIEVLGIPGLVLMENAGRNAADWIERWLRARRPGWRKPARVAIVCGRGNNGGDGLVIARHLSHRGHAVAVDMVGDPASLTPDAAANYAIVKRMGVPIRLLDTPRALAAGVRRWRTCEAVVDALLGTGFQGPVREPLAGVIRRLNAVQGPLVVAVDVPSGLDADTGRAAGQVVRADRTITFLAAKAGYARTSARASLGRVTVVDIGAPTALILHRLARGRGRSSSSQQMRSPLDCKRPGDRQGPERRRT